MRHPGDQEQTAALAEARTLVSLSSVPLTVHTGALLEVWMAFQQKWIFLNKVLHEMKIQFPSAELVRKGAEAEWARTPE